MDKYIYDDKNDLWYELQGDYYIPCLILPAEKEQPIGLWGQRHLQYLKEYRRITYLNLLTSGRLNAYLSLYCNFSVTYSFYSFYPQGQFFEKQFLFF